MKAMLLAAGLGTRLKPYTDHCPKALVEVNNKSLLEHNVRYLQQFGIYEVIVNVHHFAEQIEAAILEHDGYGSEITISDERAAVLETGGGLMKAAHFFDGEDNFAVMNVDILTNLDLSKMISAQETSDIFGTLAVIKRDSSRHLLFNGEMTLCGWTNNNTGERKISKDATPLIPYAFSGVQVLSAKVFDDVPFQGKFSLIDMYLHIAKTQTIRGYDHTGNIFIDVGKPESIEKAEYLFQ
jgi:MurNAc alpha-1-phosphate uridylyltransferase